MTEPRDMKTTQRKNILSRTRRSHLRVDPGIIYLRKWVVVSAFIGLVAAAGAMALGWGIDFFTRLFLTTIAGYVPPSAGGEGGNALKEIMIERPLLLPVCTALGGLISGIIVTKAAPEAKGIGTDAAIGAFHKGHALIRVRIPLIKLLTSAITIGSGGTSGREGPVAQIGAGFGTQIARVFRLTEKERRIALAAGLGAGIAAIFKAPLAGGLLSGELFYKHDFETEALIPGFIASTVSYSVVGFMTGWQPIFRASTEAVTYTNPQSLVFYSLLGVVCAGFVHLLFKIFFSIQRIFQRLLIADFAKPAIGGLAVGIIGIFVPSVMGVGYGWMQIALDQNLQLFPFYLMFVAIFAEIFAMSFTLGSGGSGGIFGPCVITGGLIGSIVGHLINHAFPQLGINPSSFAIVGMMAFFGGAAKSPLAVIVMIAEMTGGYHLLAPSMLTITIAYLLSGSSSVFVNQVDSLEDSPAHAEEYEALMLKRVKVSDAMTRNIQSVGPRTNLNAAKDLMEINHIAGLPVLSSGKLIGIITRTDILNVEPSKLAGVTAEQIMSRSLVTACPEEDLYSALSKMMAKGVGRLPVVTHDDPATLVGIIARTDISKTIQKARRQG